MKRQILILLVMISLFFGATSVGAQQPAEQRYIVQTTKGLTSVLNLCLSAGCQVQGSLDGGIGRTLPCDFFQKGNFLQNLLGGVLNLLERLLGIVSVEADQVLSIPLLPAATPASGAV